MPDSWAHIASRNRASDNSSQLLFTDFRILGQILNLELCLDEPPLLNSSSNFTVFMTQKRN